MTFKITLQRHLLSTCGLGGNVSNCNYGSFRSFAFQDGVFFKGRIRVIFSIYQNQYITHFLFYAKYATMLVCMLCKMILNINRNTHLTLVFIIESKENKIRDP